MLLHAGVDVNDCGSDSGIVWERNDLLGQFNHLAGYSPLFIWKEFEWIGFTYNPISYDERKQDRDKIEKLLVASGARSFQEDWACELIEEEDLTSEEGGASNNSDSKDDELLVAEEEAS